MNRAIQTDRSGALAQLVERLHGMQEVIGSIPFTSTKISPKVIEKNQLNFLSGRKKLVWKIQGFDPIV